METEGAAISVLILGLGNPLLGDDGLGATVIAELSRFEWPPDVTVMDAGTSAISCLYEISHAARLIAVDAVKAGGRPGAVYRLVPGGLGAGGNQDAGAQAAGGCDSASGRLDWSGQGSHGLALTSVIALARSMTGLPAEVVIFGAEPSRLRLTVELSDVVKAAIPTVVDAVRDEVKRRATQQEPGRGR